MKTCIEIQFQLNFRNELKRISKQHPSSSNSDIMKIASSNLKLNVNEDGSHRPCEYAVSLGINEGKERRMIYKHKKKPEVPADQVPPEVMVIKHLENDNLVEEQFVHTFDDFIIFVEKRDLIAIQESQNYCIFALGYKI